MRLIDILGEGDQQQRSHSVNVPISKAWYEPLAGTHVKPPHQLMRDTISLFGKVLIASLSSERG
jgi:hypothetical protein